MYEGRITFASDKESKKLNHYRARGFEEGWAFGMHEALKKQQQQMMIPLTTTLKANKQAARNGCMVLLVPHASLTAC